MLLACVVLAVPAIASAPLSGDDAKRVRQLAQEEKYDQAIELVDRLLEQSPKDARLLELRGELLAARKGAGTSKAASNRVAPGGDPNDRLTMASLRAILKDHAAAKDAGARQALSKEFLAASEPLSTRGSDDVWLLSQRALAALEIDRPREGWAAGKRLRELGVERNGDDTQLEILARLDRKGWLKEQSPEAIAATLNQNWSGRWVMKDADKSSDDKASSWLDLSCVIEIEFPPTAAASAAPKVAVSATAKSSYLFGPKSVAKNFESIPREGSWELPGASLVKYGHAWDGNGPEPKASFRCETEASAFSADGRVLKIDFKKTEDGKAPERCSLLLLVDSEAEHLFVAGERLGPFATVHEPADAKFLNELSGLKNRYATEDGIVALRAVVLHRETPLRRR